MALTDFIAIFLDLRGYSLGSKYHVSLNIVTEKIMLFVLGFRVFLWQDRTLSAWC